VSNISKRVSSCVRRRMSASLSAACRVCGGRGLGECACHHGVAVGGARCGVADLNRGFPGMWHQQHAEEEPAAVGAAAAGPLHEFQFFGHDEDHDSVTWLFNDPAPHLQRGPAAAGDGVVADADQQRHRQAPPPSLFDGYAAQYGQLPGHGLTFDVPLSQAGEEAVLEAGLALGGGVNPATSTSTIVSGSVPPLSLDPCNYFLFHIRLIMVFQSTARPLL
jgi:hypothetical protein